VEASPDSVDRSTPLTADSHSVGLHLPFVVSLRLRW